ncbi:phage tail protein [Herbaspirillum sp. C7C8]|uniref:phage tail protein n=1 Tax=Herbaspirillum sp. C7C8 TaxID=2736665 RepID=UPI001F51843E|nr:phage tail protein [Herbaspirillum sp. C7C8]MCI1005051.1 phage tail protein [Herbaspirillum sp. C7C8]
MSLITVYQADPQGFFLYPTEAFELPLQPGDFNIPYGALIDEPPAAQQGYVARFVENGWQLVEDHRRDLLFYRSVTAEGVEEYREYAVNTPVEVGGEVLIYDGGGPVPSWLDRQDD